METIKKLIKGLSSTIKNEELDTILSHFQVKTYQKNDFLLRENKVCTHLSIIKSGCFKVIYDNAAIVWFAFEDMPITEMQSFVNQQPSQFAIQALETAEVYQISYENLEKLYAQYDNFKLFGLRFTEKMLSKTISRATSLQFDTPEIRYQKLFDNPNYLARIPLQDLASYLGVTPNSLSRIRNRITK
jgi:CRP/FNR family transcriptional regulator, anaerobic regulatory protein